MAAPGERKRRINHSAVGQQLPRAVQTVARAVPRSGDEVPAPLSRLERHPRARAAPLAATSRNMKHGTASSRRYASDAAVFNAETEQSQSLGPSAASAELVKFRGARRSRSSASRPSRGGTCSSTSPSADFREEDAALSREVDDVFRRSWPRPRGRLMSARHAVQPRAPQPEVRHCD